MKFNMKLDHSEEEIKQFLDWLEAETTVCLRRLRRNPESLKICLFLFASRANESHMEEDLIFQTLKKCIHQAEYNEEEESIVLNLYKPIHSMAVQVHNND